MEESDNMNNEVKNRKPRLHKSFLYFSKKLKRLHANPSFLSACNHPRTPSFSSGRHAAAAAHGNDDYGGVSGFLDDNFRSLHLGPTAGDGNSSQCTSSLACSYDDGEREETAAAKAVAGGSGVAVVTFSREPYEDFRRSMQEMVDARREVPASGGGTPVVDWDFMEELLFWYLQLNDRVVHKDILRAFTDTVAALRRRRRAAPARRMR